MQLKSITGKIDKKLVPDKSFDIIKRNLVIGGRSAVLYFIDGFIKDEIYEKILEFFFSVTPEEIGAIKNMQQFSTHKLPYVEVEVLNDIDEICTAILSGPAVFIVDGVADALVIDTRTYPVRGIEEPEKNRSLRGSRDGFVETLIFNTAMVRRRIRDTALRMEYHQVGTGSKVDVAIAYLSGSADERTLSILRRKLKEIRLHGISMTQQAMAEALVKTSFFNPLPRFLFTERPDYASASILEGKIALIMDNSPSVMLLEVSVFDFFREVDDYYFLPLPASYIRIIRMIVALLTVYLVPVYLLMNNQPGMTPEWLRFAMVKEPSALPLLIQFLALEFIIDGLKQASLNTPNSLSNALGIIGGLLLSEFAVTAGWFVAEAILVMSFVAIATYSQPSFEMGYSFKFLRIAMIILTQLFGIFGIIGSTVAFLIMLFCTKTISGRNYCYPVFPFNGRDFLKLFVRNKVK